MQAFLYISEYPFVPILSVLTNKTKNTALVFLSFLLMTSVSCKKDLLHWHKVQQLSSGTNTSLNKIRFIDNNTCIIAGGVQFFQAEVTRSVDGGYTWTANSYPQAGLSMYGLCSSPTGTLYLCGEYGRTLYSRDNGATWQPGRITDYLFDVGCAFPVPDTGIFVSTVLQRQSNITRVDSNFNILNEQTFQFGLNAIYMINDSVGYVIGYGAVLKTEDRGRTWNVQNVNGDNFMCMDIHGDEIWMCGFNGSIFHTLDGGNNWERQRNGNDITQARYNILSIIFKDENNGWATCDNGKVIHTDDGGSHWEEYDQFTSSALRSIVICPHGLLLTTGDNGALFRIVP